MRRVVGETVEEMRRVQREWPEAVTISWPPRGKDSHKSKALPMLWLDADRADILEALDSAEVSEEHINLLTWFIRQELYASRVGMTDEVEKFFQTEIRGNLIRLLRAGSWVDQPVNLGLKNLNSRLEKIDLGRRSDLNFSSTQSGDLKYDVDASAEKRAALEEPNETRAEEEPPEMDWGTKYRDGSKELREEILSTRPWMRSMLTERYGEP